MILLLKYDDSLIDYIMLKSCASFEMLSASAVRCCACLFCWYQNHPATMTNHHCARELVRSPIQPRSATESNNKVRSDPVHLTADWCPNCLRLLKSDDLHPVVADYVYRSNVGCNPLKIRTPFTVYQMNDDEGN